MDSVLYKIIEIEKAAQSISEEANRAKREMSKEIEVERKKKISELEHTMKEKTDAFARIEALDEKWQKEQILQIQKNGMSSLSRLFEKNNKTWEQEVFESIIGKKWL